MMPQIKDIQRHQINRIVKKVAFIIFVLYIAIMIWELFLGNYRTFTGNRSYNLIPFKTIFDYIFNNQRYNIWILFINLFANIIVFIPLGFLLPVLKESMRKLFKVVFTSFIIILGAESIQFIFNVGILDIDDIILNMIGVIIGYCSFSITYKVLRRYK